MKSSLIPIKTVRKQSGLSQVELAARSGVSLATIQNIEADRCNPEWSTILALLNSLDVEITFYKKQIDWDRLSALGCPLMNANGIGYNLAASGTELLRTLQVLGVQLREIQSGTRESLAMVAWLSALKDHYPTVWNQVPKVVREWQDKHRQTLSPKLRRLALERMGNYL